MQSMGENNTKQKKGRKKGEPTISGVFDNGDILEHIYDPIEKKTAFALWHDGNSTFVNEYQDKGVLRVPYSPHNDIFEHNFLLLPSSVEEYGTEAELVQDIRKYLKKYVAIPSRFEKITSHYVLLTWIYDAFNELPYLRIRGDYGSGKTRFLRVVGSIVYKPIYTNGASTTSPIFHALHEFRGTLIVDEGDLRLSDEKADMVKILNNGNNKGFPVFRSEINAKKEYRLRHFNVYGPKIVATRGFYEDRALESRFIAEDMDRGGYRKEIPISLTPEHDEEARILRNKLLLYRFRNRNKERLVEIADEGIEPRINQIFAPLLSIVEGNELKEELRSLAREYHNESIQNRNMDIEANILEIVKGLKETKQKLTIGAIATALNEKREQDEDEKMTPRAVGYIVRKKLNLATEKKHGVFTIAQNEKAKLDHLFRRYGIDR